ncbi:uroporphyrinogen decarboxylase family protein [Propionibacteriaceae bacterium G1746]
MNEITKRQRFLAAARGEQVDRPPVGAWVHFGTAMADPSLAATLHLAFLASYDWDYLKVMHDFRLPTPQDGDLRERLEAFGTLGTEWASFDRQRAVLRAIREAEPDVAIVETLFSPFQTTVRSFGQDVVDIFEDDPDLANRVLGRVADLLARYAAELPSLGVDGLFLALTGASSDMSSFALDASAHRSWIGPHDRTVLNAAKGLVRIGHLHGNDLNLDLYADHEFEVTSWSDVSSSPSIAEVLAQGRVPMLGLDELASTYLAADDVHQQVLHARRAAGDRIIVAPNCTLHSDTNPEVFTALRGSVEVAL